MSANQAETLLNKHQKSSKNKYVFTMPDGTQFGTDNEDEIPAIREAIAKLIKKPSEIEEL